MTVWVAFMAIGQVAIQVKSNMSPYLDATLTCIKEALMMKGWVMLLAMYTTAMTNTVQQTTEKRK